MEYEHSFRLFVEPQQKYGVRVIVCFLLHEKCVLRLVVFSFKTCLDYFGSHLKHLTVMKSTYIYINKNAKINKTSLPPEMESRIDKIISQISDMKVELRKFEEIILKVR